MQSTRVGMWRNTTSPRWKPPVNSSAGPQLGPRGGFVHPRLREWRSFVVFRPFKKHMVFYEVTGDDVVMRRAMHGHRDLPRRLLEPPGTP